MQLVVNFLWLNIFVKTEATMMTTEVDCIENVISFQ